MNKNVIIVIAIIVIIVIIGGLAYYFINSSSSQENENVQTANEKIENEEVAHTESTENITNEDNSKDEGTTSSSSNILVVYYSASNNTERVAEIIAENTGANLFEIEPVEPYTSDDLDWTDSNSRVTQEYNDEDLRDVELVSTRVDNWNDYDTILIGYPIWWGIAAWPVNNFVTDNDFTGKTVIPFCTSSSSGSGQSGDLLEEMARTGNWQEGQRFGASVNESTITSWLEEIGLM